MSLDLGTLTLYARTSSTTNISVDARPNESGCDYFCVAQIPGCERP